MIDARAVLMAGVAILLLTCAAGACERAAVGDADRVIETSRIDQRRLDAAILAEVNYERCRAGVPAVRGASGLAKVARKHAAWMAGARTLSHRSGVSGQATTAARLRASGLLRRAGSENIGRVSRYQVDGRHFAIDRSAACAFSYGGKTIPPHSYRSLARQVVALWMQSAGHRRNLLDRAVTRAGAAAAFDSRAPYCGNFYISQNFAG